MKKLILLLTICLSLNSIGQSKYTSYRQYIQVSDSFAMSSDTVYINKFDDKIPTLYLYCGDSIFVIELRELISTTMDRPDMKSVKYTAVEKNKKPPLYTYLWIVELLYNNNQLFELFLISPKVIVTYIIEPENPHL